MKIRLRLAQSTCFFLYLNEGLSHSSQGSQGLSDTKRSLSSLRAPLADAPQWGFSKLVLYSSALGR